MQIKYFRDVLVYVDQENIHYYNIEKCTGEVVLETIEVVTGEGLQGNFFQFQNGSMNRRIEINHIK